MESILFFSKSYRRFILIISLWLIIVSLSTGVIKAQDPACITAGYYLNNSGSNYISTSGLGSVNFNNSYSPVPSRFDSTNRAIQFNGTTQYGMITSGLNSMPQGSVSIWVKRNNSTNEVPLLYHSNGSSIVFALNQTSSGLFQLMINGNAITSTSAFSDLNWHHVVAVWGTSTMSLYVDGVLQASLSQTITPFNTGNLYIGFAPIAAIYSNAAYDDLKIFNCQLTQSDIQALYHQYGWAEQTTCLRASYHFTGGSLIDDQNQPAFIGNPFNFAHVAQDRFGVEANCYAFLGDTCGLSFPPALIQNLNTGAVSVWVNPSDFNGNRPILYANNAFYLYMEDAKPKLSMNGVEFIPQLEAFNPMQWYHIVVTWNSTTTEMYVNGENVMNEIIVEPISVVSMLYVGRSTGQYFYGRIDDFRVYNCAIDQNEINDLYHEGFYGYNDFISQCLDFNDDAYPQNWGHSGNNTMENGRFVQNYVANDSSFATLERMGNIPSNVDTLILEWDAMATASIPYHLTGVTLQIGDSSVFFVHNQSLTQDFGIIGFDHYDAPPTFEFADTSIIAPGLYHHKILVSEGLIQFFAYKTSTPTVKIFNLNINPFDLNPNFSLSQIHGIRLMMKAGVTAGVQYIDNFCIRFAEGQSEGTCVTANYKFNGNTFDQSDNHYDMVLDGEGSLSFTYNRFGQSNSGVFLSEDAPQSLVTNSPTVPLIHDDVVVSVWVKPSVYGTGIDADTAVVFENYCSEGGGSSIVLGLLESTSKVFFGHVNGANLSLGFSQASIPVNQWSHIVMQRISTSNKYELYINGLHDQDYQYNASNIPINSCADGQGFVVSSDNSHPQFNYSGALDELKIGGCLLTPGQIDSLYHVGGWPGVMCEDMAITVAPTDASCGQNNGSAFVSIVPASGQYLIEWSNGDNTYTADTLSAGVYSVQVTDTVYGCMRNQFFMINNTGGPSLSLTPTHLTCFASHNGSVSSVASGGTTPYQYLWSTGAATQSISGLAAGNYALTVSDAAGCMVSQSVQVTRPAQLSATFETVNSTCGNAEGSITATISGGTPDYEYNWSTGGTSNSITGISAQNYTLTVTDAQNCTRTFATGISDSGAPSVWLDSTQSAYCGAQGAIYVNVTGGSGSYTYAWSNGTGNQDLENVEPGEYWLTVTDGSCQTMFSAEVPYVYPQTQEICVVTVNETNGKNLVVWEKAQSSGIDHYNIYREGWVADEYNLVGTVPFADMSEFTDPSASPFNRSWKYKVSAVDACGNESELSSAHKTIHLGISLGIGQTINLMWDDYAGFSYQTFFIRRHTTADGWLDIDAMPTYLHSYTDDPPSLYGLWYMVTVAAPGACVPTSQDRASGGPYYQSTSNLEDEGAIDVQIPQVKTKNMVLFPNPNNGQFLVGFKGIESGTVQIFDMSGRLISQSEFNQTDRWYNEKQLSQGIYTVQVRTSNGLDTVKMIVE